MIEFKSNRCAGCGGKLIPIAKDDPPEGTRFRKAVGIILKGNRQSSAYLCLGEGGKPVPACQELLEQRFKPSDNEPAEIDGRIGILSRGPSMPKDGDIYNRKPRADRVITIQTSPALA